AGRLAGMIMAVKDIIAMKGSRTTCGSKILEHFISSYDATVIEKMRAEDAIIIGKTNMDEFGMGSSSENSAFNSVKNPYDLQRTPGGSSGGSAVAVSAGLSMSALGTDTGGSVRQPAALTGVVGLRPTYGRISRYGLIAFASSLDQIGIFSQTVADCGEILQVIAGRDDRDSTSSNQPVPDYSSFLNKGVEGLQVGMPKEFFNEGLDHEIKTEVEKITDMMKEEGAVIREVSLPHTDYGIATYYLICTAEASSNLARYDGVQYGFRESRASDLESMYTFTRSEGLGDEVKRRIMLGTYVLSAGYYDAYYLKAQKVRTIIRKDYDRVFQNCDVIIGPTTPTTAFKLGEKCNDPLKMYLSDIYTVTGPLAWIPAISVPIGKDSNGLPIGFQITAKPFDEGQCLRVAHWIEYKLNGCLIP
ncbi:Asp-tRNA(Asn)/Glu-tRNA(Gln) amidotransferase subunit GatA, partial [bacterium]|nr:Asp-tRNA(Asn)/Glu-tRNA(Gln) amidotransferase subunit GatA [bacterium]